MLVVGRSGAGKTTFFYNLIDRLNAADVPVLVSDFKQDYRGVADDLDLTVVNWRDLKFNPLQPPPGVSTGKWAEVLADTWTHAMGLLNASRNYVLRKLGELYGYYGEEIDESGRYPSLFELRRLARADDIPYASPRFNYKERVDNRTSGMLAFSGSIFDCSRGLPIEQFLDRNVVLELDEPNQDVQKFVVEALLTWIFYYRKAQGHDSRGLRHVVMFDEAKQVFDVQREENRDIPHPPITTLMARVRSFGEGLVVAEHEPSKLSDSVKANTNLKLWLSLGSGKDTGEMAETFGLDDDAVDLTRTLDRGEAVLKSAAESPVPVNLPMFRVESMASDAAVREDAEGFVDDQDWAERVQPDLYLYAVDEDPMEADDGRVDRDVDPVAERVLVSAVERPFLSMSKRYDAVDVGPERGGEAVTELKQLGLVDDVEVDTKRPGRNPTLLELTRDGVTWLEDHDHDVPDWGRRSIVHRYWQRQVADSYAAEGYEVKEEYSVADGYIDVYAEQGNTAVAVEVALSPEHEVANVRKCLDTGVELVEVVTVDDAVQDRVRAQVQEAFDGVPNHVAFVDAREYAG
jgi:hypothetical protein